MSKATELQGDKDDRGGSAKGGTLRTTSATTENHEAIEAFENLVCGFSASPETLNAWKLSAPADVAAVVSWVVMWAGCFWGHVADVQACVTMLQGLTTWRGPTLAGKCGKQELDALARHAFSVAGECGDFIARGGGFRALQEREWMGGLSNLMMAVGRTLENGAFGSPVVFSGPRPPLEDGVRRLIRAGCFASLWRAASGLDRPGSTWLGSEMSRGAIAIIEVMPQARLDEERALAEALFRAFEREALRTLRRVSEDAPSYLEADAPSSSRTSDTIDPPTPTPVNHGAAMRPAIAPPPPNMPRGGKAAAR